MKYQEPEMKFIEFELGDVCTASWDDDNIWSDDENDYGGNEGGSIPNW